MSGRLLRPLRDANQYFDRTDGRSSEGGDFLQRSLFAETPGSLLSPALRQPPSTPWLSEEAHVQSLQQPDQHQTSSGGSLNLQHSSSIYRSESPIQTPRYTPSASFQVTAPTGPQQIEMSGKHERIPMGSRGNQSKRSLVARLFSNRPVSSRGEQMLLSGEESTESVAQSSDDYTSSIIKGASSQLGLEGHVNGTDRKTNCAIHREGPGPESTCSKKQLKVTFPLKLFGKSPWHRKASAESLNSASSSLRDILRGRTPVSSVNSSPEERPAVWSEQYPGGEATRVKTPPLYEATHNGKQRSFFFDISKPGGEAFNECDRSDGNGKRDSESTIHSSDTMRISRPSQQPKSDNRSENPPQPTSYTGRPSSRSEVQRSQPTLAQHHSTGQKPCNPHGKMGERRGPKEWWEVPVRVATWDALAAAAAVAAADTEPRVIASNNTASPAIKPSRKKERRGFMLYGKSSNGPISKDSKTRAESLKVPRNSSGKAVPQANNKSQGLSSARQHRYNMVESRSFEFDLPEHLPTSPMCPANKKHRSGGTGVCVYHGRRKRTPPSVAENDNTDAAPTGALGGMGTVSSGSRGAKLAGSKNEDEVEGAAGDKDEVEDNDEDLADTAALLPPADFAARL